MYITTYETLCDWLTLTTYEESVFAYYRKIADGAMSDGRKNTKYHKLPNYSGYVVSTDNGGYHIYEGMQAERKHYMVILSGELANMYVLHASNLCRSGLANVTRVDLQITVDEPKKWCQWTYINAMKAAGKSVGWAESKHRKAGALETVYVGSRTSNKFGRVYIKVTAGGARLLRFEIEFKKKHATELMARLHSGAHSMSAILKYETRQRSTQLLWSTLSPYLGEKDYAIKVKVESDNDKLREWLRTACLPSLVRYLNANQSDVELRNMFYNASLSEPV